MPRTAFCFIRNATTGFTVSAFPYPSRVSLKEAFAVLELCAGKLACTVLRGPDPSNGVWLLGAMKENRWNKVKALQRLLTYSYSGKVLAVRRVTENNGKGTPVLTVLSGRHQKIKSRQYVTSGVGNIILSPYDVFTSRKSRTELRSVP